jgi:hypothetical protein
MSDDHFSQIVVADFEYEIVAGGLPNPLCMVGVVLDENFRHVRTIRMCAVNSAASPRSISGRRRYLLPTQLGQR